MGSGSRLPIMVGKRTKTHGLGVQQPDSTGTLRPSRSVVLVMMVVFTRVERVMPCTVPQQSKHGANVHPRFTPVVHVAIMQSIPGTEK